MANVKNAIFSVLLLSVILSVFSFAVYGAFSITTQSPASNAYLAGVVTFNATTQNDTTNVTWQFSNAALGAGTLRNFTATSGTNISGTNSTQFTLSINLSNITDGVYTIITNASNVSNVTGLLNTSTNVTIDNTAPASIVLSLPANMSNFTSAQTLGFNWTAIDGLDTQLSCNLTVGGTVRNTTVNSINNTLTSVTVALGANGNYTWSVACSDDSGFALTSGTNTVTIDTSAPTITFVEPSSVNESFTDTFTAAVTVTDDRPVTQVNYSIYNQSNTTQQYRNGSMTLSGTSATASISITGLQGAYTINVNATDANGFVTNITRDFNFDNVPPGPITFSLSDSSVEVGDSISGTCTAPDLFSTATTVITGIDTTTAGSKIATCTATDVAGNTATLGASYTVTAASGSSDSGSGGGSGGSGASGGASSGASAGSSGASIEVDLDGGVVKTITMPESSAIDSIMFTPNSDVSNVLFTVRGTTTAPTGVGELMGHGTVYKYLHVLESKEVSTGSATIAFKVDLDWLATHGEELALYRLDGTTWKEFKATLKSKDAKYAHYSATVSGLSYYAIAAATGAVAPTPVVEAAPEPAAAPTPAPVVAPKKSSTGTILIVLVLAALIGAGVYFYRKNR